MICCILVVTGQDYLSTSNIQSSYLLEAFFFVLKQYAAIEM